MKKFEVTGMSCAACVARVEKAVTKVNGVERCSVNLLTNSMQVEGSALDSDIITAVEQAGYGAKSLNKTNTVKEPTQNELKDTETPLLLKRLISSLVILLILMYFSMGHMMWGWPLPAFFVDNHVAMGLVQLFLSGIILLINKKFFISGTKSLIHGAPNMDTLVALGSGVSFLWSIYCLFAMTRAQLDGNSNRVMELMNSFCFESAATILTLITVGKTLEAKSKGKTTDALKDLMKLSPKTAVLIQDGKEVSVDIDQVLPDDTFVIKPGDAVPVDGLVLEGNSAVNESALTGESIPVDKAPGQKVYSGTINQNGFLKCRALKVGEDTTLSQIIHMVSDAAASKAPIAKIADKVSGVFVPVVISIALITLIVWLCCGASFNYALARGISVLVISCPCALGLATPVAIMVGSGKGARTGILFKTAESLEKAGKVDVVVLDKTGTITKGEPVVTDIEPFEEYTEHSLLRLAVSLENKSEHPLAKAIVKKAAQTSVIPDSVSDFNAVSGRGVSGKINNTLCFAGNLDFIKENLALSESQSDLLQTKIEALSLSGKTALIFGVLDNEESIISGIIAVSDVIKEDSAKAILSLRKMGKKVYMLTGDNKLAANEIGRQAGVDEVIAEVLPEGKYHEVKRLQSFGYKVAMVGDGINDAPALTAADVGIAIGAGTDVAIDAADVVLVKSSLSDAVAAIRLGKKTLVNIKQNLFWAFIYNVIGIPLAAGCYIKAFGWTLNPMFGAAAMSLSSFCVVMNALRLNFAKLYDKQDSFTVENQTVTIQEEKNMTKVYLIEGMMCGHCEAHVKAALEKIDGVISAVTSHTEGTAVVELSKEVSEDEIKAAVVAEGYEYKGIKA